MTKHYIKYYPEYKNYILPFLKEELRNITTSHLSFKKIILNSNISFFEKNLSIDKSNIKEYIDMLKTIYYSKGTLNFESFYNRIIKIDEFLK